MNWRTHLLRSLVFVLAATPGIPFHVYFPLMFALIFLWSFRRMIFCPSQGSEGERR